MKCNIHVTQELIPQKTKYGTRWSCPVPGCTVVCWGSETSTPADEATRRARIQVHKAFDALWRSGRWKRQRAYKKLAKFLGLPIKKTHIGCFSLEQCQRAIDFCKTHKKGGDTE